MLLVAGVVGSCTPSTQSPELDAPSPPLSATSRLPQSAPPTTIPFRAASPSQTDDKPAPLPSDYPRAAEPSPPESSPPESSPLEVDSSCHRGEAVTIDDGPATGEPFSARGYVGRFLRLTRTLGEREAQHCLTVVWPRGPQSNDGRACSVARHVDAAWFRAIENTLARVPWHHVTLLRRLVIDNRPTAHGIAPFDRADPHDARDGRTIWLSEHLFRAPNHWARGNYGRYWAYHASEDGVVFDDASADHEWFSPILLHELGHLVMYGWVNAPLVGPFASDTPDCAKTCADTGDCAKLSPKEREQPCVSPYCVPFGFPASTENWAEQYRLYYQSAETRRLLEETAAGCLDVLRKHDAPEGEPRSAPWERGLPNGERYTRSRWKSCAGTACKRL